MLPHLALFSLIPAVLATPYLLGKLPGSPGYKNASTVIATGPYCPPQPAQPPIQNAIFKDFIDKLYVKENAEDAYLTYVSPDYINHSPYSGQGREDAIQFLSYFIPTKNRTILHVTFDGGIGVVHLKVEDDPPLALSDFFRMNGTCIEEHWDVVQALPANATNPIALF